MTARASLINKPNHYSTTAWLPTRTGGLGDHDAMITEHAGEEAYNAGDVVLRMLFDASPDCSSDLIGALTRHVLPQRNGR